MEVLYLLIPLSLLLVALIAWAILWAIRSGQFDDLDGPAYRILDDERDLPAGEQRDAARARDDSGRHDETDVT